MKVRALLFDLDGTIYHRNYLIPGAIETLLTFKNASIPYRFVTNCTRMTKKEIVLMLGNMGMVVSPDDIFAAPHAAAKYCHKKGYKKILLAIPNKEMAEDFIDFQLVDHNPEAIVLGDMGSGFTFNLINILFNLILNGAELVAMHKNRYWLSNDGCRLDVGALVSALEYASGKPASIMGKPNSNLFVLASEKWNIPADKIVMIGDDIEGDVGGAVNAGMKSDLVKTGKFKQEFLQSSVVKPNYIIDSIADLPSIINL